MLFSFAPLHEHLRISPTDDDAILLPVYAQAALDHIRAVTGLPLPDDTSLPDGIMAALLLLVGDLYENRVAASEVKLHGNPAVDRLLAPYRLWDSE